MKANYVVVGVLSLLLLWSACANNTPKQTNAVEEKAVVLSLRESADSVMRSLKRTDMAALRPWISHQGSILFSPYSYVDTLNARRLSAQDFSDFFGDTTQVQWGQYDGSGLPIMLSPAEYYKTFIYNHAFAEADSVFENKSIQRGNSTDNLSEIFPGNEHVEYFVAGDSKNAGLGWGSLTLVFRKEGNRYFLVGVVNNRWTI
ncbi:MAG: hypothetical protein ACR2IL_07780 [Chitinophagaceae bacterium]